MPVIFQQWPGLPSRGTLFLAAMLLAGCQQDAGIHEKDEPIPVSETEYPDSGEPKKIAILGGIAPGGGGEQWIFFKMIGPATEVEKQRKQFDRFIGSLIYHPENEIPFSWQTPEGWQWRQSESGFRLATFKMGPVDTEFLIEPIVVGWGDLGPTIFLTWKAAIESQYPELSVSKARGTLLANVNRWREQVGLESVESVSLPRLLRYRHVDGATIILVEMSGPGGKKPSMGAMPPFHPALN